MLKQLHLMMLICISTFILSCSSDVEDKSSEKNTSTFSLTTVKDVSTRSFSEDPLWPELKNKNITDLKVCIVDTIYKDNIAGAKFTLTTNEKSENLISDIHGCVNWQVETAFDYTSDEQFILYSGTIEGSDNFKGIQKLRFAINPWTGKVVDLEKGGSVGKLTTSKTMKNRKTIQNQINFNKAIIDVKEIEFVKNYSTNISMDTIIKPFLVRKKIDGTKGSPEYFTNGKFQLDFLLIQKEYGSRKKSILAEAKSIDQINEEGDLASSIHFEIKEEVMPRATIELAVRVTPVNQVHRIGRKFNSLILNSIHGRKAYDVNPTTYGYNQVKALTENKENSNSYEVNHGLKISQIKGSYLVEDGIANDNPDTSLRERKARISIHLVDTLLHQGTNGEFEVTVYDTVEETIVDKSFRKNTNGNNGSGLVEHTLNFQFDSSFEYDYRKYIVKVRGLNGIYRDLDVQRDIYVNPRVKGDGFLIDSKDISDPSDLGTGKKIAAWMDFKQYSFEFRSNSKSDEYKLNRNLDLLGYREMRVTVKPEIKTTHNYNSDQDDYELPDSSFKVKMMILTPKNPLLQHFDRKIDLNDFYVLTGAELEDVKSDGGVIFADLKFPHLFVEKNLLSFKNIAVLLVEPQDPNSKIGGGYHIGKVDFFLPMSKINSLYDSRLDDNDIVRLKGSNTANAIAMGKKIKELKTKLQDDLEILDPYTSFKQDVLANNSFEDVPVIDHENYRVNMQKAYMNISDSEEMFLSQNPELDLTEDDLLTLFETRDFSGKVGEELCQLYYNPNQKTYVTYLGDGGPGGGMPIDSVLTGTEYRRCKSDTNGHFQIKELKFVDKITTQPGKLEAETGDPTVVARGLTLGRNEAFFSAKGSLHSEIQGERTSSYIGIANHTSLDIVGKLGGPLSIFSAFGPDIGIRKDYYKMSQKTELESHQRRIINQNGQTFQVSTYNISFRAMVNRCFLIAPKYVRAHIPRPYVGQVDSWRAIRDWFTNKDSRSVVSSPVRNLICMSAPVEQEITEQYYFVKLTDTNKSAMVDSSMAKNTVGSIIRGKKAYKEFRALDLKNDKLILFQDKQVEDEVKKHYQDAIDNGRDPEQEIFMDTIQVSEVLRRYKYFMNQMGKDIKYKDRMGIGYPGLIELE